MELLVHLVTLQVTTLGENPLMASVEPAQAFHHVWGILLAFSS
jgi:hypothetical protein